VSTSLGRASRIRKVYDACEGASGPKAVARQNLVMAGTATIGDSGASYMLGFAVVSAALSSDYRALRAMQYRYGQTLLARPMAFH